jgi:hypothetical protein
MDAVVDMRFGQGDELPPPSLVQRRVRKALEVGDPRSAAKDLLRSYCGRDETSSFAGLLVRDYYGNPRVFAVEPDEELGWHLFGMQRAAGPAFDCMRSHSPIELRQLRVLGNCPFAVRAHKSGYDEASAVPLIVNDDCIGAIGIVGGQPGSFPSPDFVGLATLVAHALVIGASRPGNS